MFLFLNWKLYLRQDDLNFRHFFCAHSRKKDRNSDIGVCSFQGVDLTAISCIQFQDHLLVINVTSGREAYSQVFVHAFVFSESHLHPSAKLC